MTSNKDMAILFKMIESLRKAGNWTGETSIHKAFYILHKLMNVDIRYSFTLYLHGPFSFELRDDICKYVAYDFIKLEYESANYGPKHNLTGASKNFLEKHKRLITDYDQKIENVCNLIKTNSVLSLERLATALYVMKELNRSGEEAVDKLIELKPHIKSDEARNAVDEVTGWIKSYN